MVEIRRIKARVDSERLPRGADPATHFKLGRGGLADVEWTVQLLQMQHAGARPRAADDQDARGAAGGRRRTTCSTPPTPRALAEAWRFASRARNATVQVRGKPSDQLPRDAVSARRWRAILRLRARGSRTRWSTTTCASARRARAIVDRVFWG